MSELIDLKSMTLDEMKNLLEEWGEKPFRAAQLYDWIHVKLAASFEEMTNLSASFREKLSETCELTVLKAERFQESKLDGTKKALFALSDRNMVESVWMKYEHGNSVCISSQVGCAMGCRFCASTIGGKVRDLTPAEMLDQIYALTRITGERVSNVVVMGTGEPMDNFDNVVRFIKLLTNEHGLHISQRNITVSTCGIVPGIYQLAKEKFQITLALSLHAATDEKRREIMPIANKYSIRELMDACRTYFDETGRRITFEYSLIAGVNDTAEDVRNLAHLAGPLNSHINLIPVNPVRERSFVQPDHHAVLAFKNKLEKYHINVTIRRELGRDIDGACGQLRRSYKLENES